MDVRADRDLGRRFRNADQRDPAPRALVEPGPHPHFGEHEVEDAAVEVRGCRRRSTEHHHRMKVGGAGLMALLRIPGLGTNRCEPGWRQTQRFGRSEEHTSELQSLMRISYAVFCLKKKKTHIECNQCL